MTTAWFLNTVGLLLTTIGALLIFLYLWRSPKFADAWLTPEGKLAYAKQQRLLTIGVGLLAGWLLIDYLAIILV